MSHDHIKERMPVQLELPFEGLAGLAKRDAGLTEKVTIECNDRRAPTELRFKPAYSQREWWLKQTDLYCPACSVRYGVYVDAGFGHGGNLGYDYVCVNCSKWWIMSIEPIQPSGHAKDMIAKLKEYGQQNGT